MNNCLTERLKEKVLILDGSTGTMLQKNGMPSGVSPEQFCIDNPEIIQGIQDQYIKVGSDIVYAATFGANRVKLKNFGLENQTYEINKKLAELSCAIAHPKGKLVGGSMGPTGIFFAPFGETSFEEGHEIYTEQIKGLIDGGVDLLIIETQIDIQEARIAFLAAKECCDLPVIVSMTFDEAGRTLTGSDPLTCLNIFQSLGAAGFGVNCSTGPDKMLAVVEELGAYARIPIMVKPNAGLPVIEKGETVFPMAAQEFCRFSKSFFEAGVTIMGGCCGTTPEHISCVAQEINGLIPSANIKKKKSIYLSSARKTIAVSGNNDEPIRVIGERINPTGKSDFQEELKHGKMDQLKIFAVEQQEKGADVLDVNVGMAGINEKEVMLKAIAELAVLSDLPLCIDSSKPEVLEAAIRFYPGRVLLNSLSGESEKLAHIIPVIKKYGPAFITLPLHDKGIPETIEERKEVLKTILKQCDENGVNKEDAVVDGLVLTVSSDQEHARTTLETIRYVVQEEGLNTVLGLSNVSFGMPARAYLNSGFLAMAAAEGLSMVIANPSAPLLMDLLCSSNVLTGRDKNGARYIERFANINLTSKDKVKNKLTPEEALRDGIIKGEKENIIDRIKVLLEKNKAAYEIVDQVMVPAIQLVGEKYNKREYFLPQLIAAAETMETGVQYLTPLMNQDEQNKKGVGVLATVKGDIHDIGKKIVALMLRNNGYEIIDLGKAVDEETIVNKAIEVNADFIGLSALMTTTMTEMPKVIVLAKEKGISAKVIVGGAVVTRKFADEIGAEGYALDAGQAVDVVDMLLKRV